MLPIVRTQELGPPAAMLLTGRTQELGQAEVTLPIGRMRVIGQALARVLSPDRDRQPAHDHQHAMCKIFSTCQMPVAGMSVLAARQVASVTWPRPQVGR